MSVVEGKTDHDSQELRFRKLNTHVQLCKVRSTKLVISNVLQSTHLDQFISVHGIVFTVVNKVISLNNIQG